MTKKPSLVDVRARVRTRETWELLLLAGGLQNVAFDGNPPRAAVARFQAMQEEVVVELERRGVAVAPNPDLICRATFAGDHDNSSRITKGDC